MKKNENNYFNTFLFKDESIITTKAFFQVNKQNIAPFINYFYRTVDRLARIYFCGYTYFYLVYRLHKWFSLKNSLILTNSFFEIN